MKKKLILVIVIITLLIVASISIAKETSEKKNEEFGFDNITISRDNRFCLMFFDWRIRTYLIHIPPSYDGETAVPLVILLHSYGNNGRLFSIRSEMNIKADEEGFIVVYPNGATLRDKGWNAGFCCGPAMRQNVDDLGFIKSVIEKTKKRYNIDTNRIYVAGFSNGGMMTYRFASEFSEEIAAIAVAGGQIGGNISDFRGLWVIPEPSEPLPVIIFHGTNDTVVPYGGGRRPCDNPFERPFLPIYLSINESVSFWVEHNKCDPDPEINIIADGHVVTRTYKNGTNGSEVILYTVLDGGHWWFGGAWLRSTLFEKRGNDPFKYISATDIIWEFFEQHPKK